MIVYHFQESLVENGYLGVDVFFVISGYVITNSLLSRRSGSLREFLSSFYARRLRRLLPALLACVLVTSSVAILVNPEPRTSLITGALSLFGFSNIYLFMQAEDDFAAPSLFNHFTQTWSLGVEEKFYFVFPFLVWIGRRNISILRLGIIALSAASLVAYLYFSTWMPMAAFYLMPLRFWELGAGCLLALYPSRLLRFPSIPLVLLVGLMLSPAHSLMITPAAIFFTAWLIGAIAQDGPTKRFFSLRPIVYCREISYSLYLCHWSVLSIARWQFDIGPLHIVAMIVLTFVLAAMSHRFVEQPFRSGLVFSDFRTVIGGLTTAAGAALFLGATLTIPQLNAKADEPKFAKGRIIQTSMECHSPRMQNPFEFCLKRRDEQRTIFILGDSHASNLLPSVVGGVKGMPVTVQYLADGGVRSHELKAKADYVASQMRPGDILLFSLWRDRLYAPKLYEGASRKGLENKRFIADLKIGLSHMAAVVDKIGATFVVVDDIPQLCSRETYILLLNKGALTECSTPSDISRDDRSPLSDLYRSIVKAQYLDPHDALCDADIAQCFGMGINFMEMVTLISRQNILIL